MFPLKYPEFDVPIIPATSYQAYVKALCSRNPCLQTLAHFLSANPPHARNFQIAAIDFRKHGVIPEVRSLPDCDLLPRELEENMYCNDRDEKPQLHFGEPNPLWGRIIIIEDLTRELIEMIGTELDIDPLFFAMHLHTARKTGMRYQAPQEATLPSRVTPREYINISYHRAVNCEKIPRGCEKLVRNTSIDRKIVFIRSTTIGLVQHCASVILIKNKRSFWISLILVDPPITNTFLTDGRSSNDPKTIHLTTTPFLGTYEDFLTPPSFSEFAKSQQHNLTNSSILEDPNRGAMLNDLKQYWTRSIPPSFDPQDPTLHSLSYFPLKIIGAEWIRYIAVMHHCLKSYEYNTAQLPPLKQFNQDLRELQTWRRRSMMSQRKLEAVAHFLSEESNPDTPTLLPYPSSQTYRTAQRRPTISYQSTPSSLQKDYALLLASLTSTSAHLSTILPTIITFIQIADTRRSYAETANVTRLTILALVFVPLTYVSSLFSMNSENAPGSDGFWVYFVVAVPVTILVACVARPPVGEVRMLVKWVCGRRRGKGKERGVEKDEGGGE